MNYDVESGFTGSGNQEMSEIYQECVLNTPT